ncbi:hypothetical protein phytr_11530 [Candidatus Phycorickettsia trachydisci]|uniref:Uncharacterized protein n=1 Tax=Candidatus Phycorickettsia trachydisci TaxID=2115978 RepID=A0A2P1P9Y8_9RICK|nr:hypothetical protein [Candidatus Phycorickettsia trachydisci]AVP88078.1 hypothetical protein phytr_11530 [Candidatus Phycorickettsia trachydisci]
MDEGVKVMGEDPQERIPVEAYAQLIREWVEEVDKHKEQFDFFKLLNKDPKELRNAVYDKIDELSLSETAREDLPIALEALSAALRGEKISGLLPEGISRKHASSKPFETREYVK